MREAVLATAIRIDAVAKADIGAIVLADDCASHIGQRLRWDFSVGGMQIFVVLMFEIVFQVRALEAIRRRNLLHPRPVTFGFECISPIVYNCIRAGRSVEVKFSAGIPIPYYGASRQKTHRKTLA